MPGQECDANGARHGGKLKIIAGIERPRVIAKILSHLQRTAPPVRTRIQIKGGQGRLVDDVATSSYNISYENRRRP